MTEDDWRWHMYDTVRLAIEMDLFTRLHILTYGYRSKVRTGSATRTPFIT